MKKILKIIVVILLLATTYVYFGLYPKFDIVSGFSSKSIASHHFLAKRSVQFTEEKDNDVPSMELATNIVDENNKSVSSSVYGFKKRKAIYRDGLGALLIPERKNYKNASSLVPKRNLTNTNLPYPYGNLPQKDTIFANVKYKDLQAIVTNAIDIDTTNTRALLVIYKNQIIAEKYNTGFDKNSLLLGWSMAKSITSGVLGVLEKQGKVHLKQNHLFKEWENDTRSKITLKNLLNMNSGLEWEEDYTKICDVTEMLFLDSDMSQKQKNKPFVGKPNETWNYSSGTTNLLSGFIKNQFKTQQDYLDFWYAELIDKIGMHSMLIETDFSGNYVGSSYAWATARDWAKFGLLYLHNGNWNGQQIINKSWVDFTREPTNTSNGEYGGHFWLNAKGFFPDAPRDMFSCNGYQGQRIFIIPSKDLIIVRFGLGGHATFNKLLKDIVATIQ